jgi:protoporphyrinogen IX oxidase
VLWLKAFHVVAMVTWFAGLFYLPRLFVYHADTHESTALQRFCTMERRLFALMTIGAAATLIFGLVMVLVSPAYLTMGWLHAKLTLVALLVVYHVYCYKYTREFAQLRNTRTAKYYRIFNEIPSLLLLGIVILAVVKPG